MNARRTHLEAMIERCQDAWRNAADDLSSANALHMLRLFQMELARLNARTEAETDRLSMDDEPLPE